MIGSVQSSNQGAYNSWHICNEQSTHNLKSKFFLQDGWKAALSPFELRSHPRSHTIKAPDPVLRTDPRAFEVTGGLFGRFAPSSVAAFDCSCQTATAVLISPKLKQPTGPGANRLFQR